MYVYIHLLLHRPLSFEPTTLVTTDHTVLTTDHTLVTTPK